MDNIVTPPTLDLIEQIPDPDTVRGWISETVRKRELLRGLLRVAIRKAAYKRPSSRNTQEGTRHG